MVSYLGSWCLCLYRCSHDSSAEEKNAAERREKATEARALVRQTTREDARKAAKAKLELVRPMLHHE